MIDVTLKGRTGTAAAPFYALSVEHVAFIGDNVPVDGETVAILSPDGDTLALGYAEGGAVDLNLNTAEADGATTYLEPTETIRAALVVGDTDNVRAIVGIELGRNVLDELAPPPELAPKYPTSTELLAILAEMTAQAQRAEDSVEATETAQKAVAEYVDVTFPTKVTEAEERLENATTEGVQAVTDKANQAIGAITSHTSTIVTALDNKQTAILSNIDNKAKAVNSAFDNKVTEANTAIDGKVTEANDAKTDAVKAKDKAETAKGEAEGFATSASESAEQASKSAKQAEDAKDAIGDVSGRLDAVEASVAERAPRISKYLRGMFDYTLVEIKKPSTMFYQSCHDGWIAYGNYFPYERFHISSTGLLTEILRNVSSAGATKLFTVIDTINSVTKFYENQSGTYYLTTISGVGDNVAISRVKIDALPNEAIASYSHIYGLVLKNGFVVCSKGQILDANLNEIGTFNCSATKFPMTQLVRTADNTVKFFDTSTRQISQITIADDGTFTFKSNSYIQEAQSSTLFYLMIIPNFESAIKVKLGKVTRNGNSVGYFYNETPLPFGFYGGTRNGIICNGKDLFSTSDSSNKQINTSVQQTFGLAYSFDRKNHIATLYEDGFGNFAVFETPITIYEENTGYLHIFKKK